MVEVAGNVVPPLLGLKVWAAEYEMADGGHTKSAFESQLAFPQV